MISSIEEAKELCVKYGIKLSEHKTVIVTGNNSIYLSDNIDPADTSEKFFLKGATLSIEADKKEKIKKEEPKEISDSEIEEQIIEEEKEDKLKDKKSKK